MVGGEVGSVGLSWCSIFGWRRWLGFLRGFRSVGMIKAGSMGGLLMGKKPCTHTSTPPTSISRHVDSSFSEVIRIPLMLSSNHQA